MKTMRGRVNAVMIGLGAIGLVACQGTEDVDSTDVRTSGVYADMQVVATGDGQSEVTASLWVGGEDSNTYLDLQGDDNLVASAGNDSRSMTRRGEEYEAVFDADAGGTEFNVAFKRGRDDTTAPHSHVVLPDPFVLAGLDPRDTASRSEGFTLTWQTSSAGNDMRLALTGGCLHGERNEISDSGSITFNADDLETDLGHEDDTCDAEICVERYRSGAVDPAFGEGGEFDAIQRRCISFISVP